MKHVPVLIVGAGPAGLMLGHLLHLRGIDSLILEVQTEAHVVERVRAGVLEQGTVDLMQQAGVGDRLAREGLRHRGVFLAYAGRRHHVDLETLTGGRGITVYGQNEVVKDLIAARRASDRPLSFEVADVSLRGIDTDRPRVGYTQGGTRCEVSCDVVAGCDGFHGICRPSIPAGRLKTYERTYPFAWLGILADAAPSSDELVYSRHESGFALFSMRSPRVTRLYLQVPPDESLAAWPDDRVWEELRLRLATDDGWAPNEGPILQKGITLMRSFVAEPMQYGRLYLAGDAAHIVPPTGAKGLNLAMADVWRLSSALAAFFEAGSTAPLEGYSASCLRRAWRAQRFSWWMTSMLHRQEGATPFDERRQLAELEHVIGSRAAMAALAEDYVGMPFDRE